jgi:asparagine synthase (glutamine-hydrolysing)
VLDRHEKSVFLALDRIGAEKLAFAASAAGIVFASQADMVAAHPAVGRELDPQGLFNYLYFFQVPAPGSIFKGVEKLLPAQWAYWKNGEVSRGFYWALKYRDEPRERLRRAVRRFSICCARAWPAPRAMTRSPPSCPAAPTVPRSAAC